MFWNSKQNNNDKRKNKKKRTILTDDGVIKITLTYLVQGIRKREDARLRFFDGKECFLSSQMSVIKPKPKTQILLAVYTPDGVYKSNVTLIEVIDNVNERLLSINVPEVWNLSQMRVGSRVNVDLPVKVKYADGLEISATTQDISLGGVSFYLPQEIPQLYKQMPAICLLKLPNNVDMNFSRGFMACEAKFQREKDVDTYSFGFGGTLYVYKFLTMNNDDIVVLKDFISEIKIKTGD